MSVEVNAFSGLDYFIFIAVLTVSVLIGIYHAMFAGRQKTSEQYFLANRSMHSFPVAVSVAVSIVSAITYLGTPAEVYLRGPGYWPSALSRPFAGYLVVNLLLPVFYNLKITSVFEYLGMRFSPTVRYIAVAVQFAANLLGMGLAVYAPALVLNAVTGLSLYGSILTVGIVCTFYSAVGGIKAVIWVDMFQSAVMVVGFVTIIATGCSQVGGVETVWLAAVNGNRSTVFDFRFDPTIRFTFWSTFLGGSATIFSVAGVNQNIAQRALTCKDLHSAKWAVFIGLCMFGVLELLAVAVGVVIFAYYDGCDPLTLGQISRVDQIVPYFMVEVFSGVPGLTGFLVSAIFSAALSSVSTAINATATVTGKDIVKILWPSLPDELFTFIVKISAVFFGCAFMATAFLASSLGSLIQVSLGVIGAIYGPVLGMFLLGVLVPRANNTGAFVGFASGLAFGLWILIGSMKYPPPSADLPLSIDNCPRNSPTPNYIDVTTSHSYMLTSDPMSTNQEMPGEDTVPFQNLYSVSFLFTTLFTCTPCFIVGILVSILTNNHQTEFVDQGLLSPVILSAHRNAPKFIQDMVKIKTTAVNQTSDTNNIALG